MNALTAEQYTEEAYQELCKFFGVPPTPVQETHDREWAKSIHEEYNEDHTPKEAVECEISYLGN